MEVDQDFTSTEYFQKLSWLKNENDDLYDPNYSDLLRVAFTSEFHRGKLADLVSLLSGRNFETRTYEEEIARNSFDTLRKGILNFINENNFKKFIMIVKSSGFITSSLIRSSNALNFSYILYLTLRSLNYPQAEIERLVRRWFLMSILTGRYSGQIETRFDNDIRYIANRDIKDYLDNIERAELSEAFWETALPQNLNTSGTNNPYFNVYLAAQVKGQDKGFLSRDISVYDLILHLGNIHHVFPRDFLKSNGLKRSEYNQVANYVIMQSEINIKIGSRVPQVYFNEIVEQCKGGDIKYGGINDLKTLKENLKMHCIPETIFGMNLGDYQDFLCQRRLLISKKIKDYYFSL